MRNNCRSGVKSLLSRETLICGESALQKIFTIILIKNNIIG